MVSSLYTLLCEGQDAEGACCRAQDGPGLYNDDAWEALDRVLDEARRAGLKVMLSFLDNWKYIGEPSPLYQHHPLKVNAESSQGFAGVLWLLCGKFGVMPWKLVRQSLQCQRC